MNLVGDVGDEPQVPAFDDDIVVGGELVGDRVQARGRRLPGEVGLLLQFHEFHVSLRSFGAVLDFGDGFGFAKRVDGAHEKIVQSGVTVIEDDVEIQSLSNIDRASVGETRVRRGAKIDSLVQVGHACVVGEDNIICAQTGLAGSSILKKGVLLAGQVGVSGHLTTHHSLTPPWRPGSFVRTLMKRRSSYRSVFG